MHIMRKKKASDSLPVPASVQKTCESSWKEASYLREVPVLGEGW